VVEIPWPRQLLRRILSGVGEPYIVVRLGYVDATERLPATPRRSPGETIQVDE
jgi:hypothetical protein